MGSPSFRCLGSESLLARAQGPVSHPYRDVKPRLLVPRVSKDRQRPTLVPVPPTQPDISLCSSLRFGFPGCWVPGFPSCLGSSGGVSEVCRSYLVSRRAALQEVTSTKPETWFHSCLRVAWKPTAPTLPCRLLCLMGAGGGGAGYPLLWT